jgi:hypothetical protein
VLHKVLADLQAAGIEQSEHQVRARMDEFMAEAVKQLEAEG